MRIKYPFDSIAEGILQSRICLPEHRIFKEFSLIHMIDKELGLDSYASYTYLGNFHKSSYGLFLLTDIIDKEKLKGYLEYQYDLFSRMNNKNNIIPFKKK